VGALENAGGGGLKWFKHESRAHRDAKLQKLVIRYGFEGYGLYWYCVENVCSGLEPNLTFELESDSEILAHIGRMDSRKVEEIMQYMVSVGLFESSNNVITCLKLARYLGESGTRNQGLRAIIKGAKSGEVSDGLILSQTVSDCLPKRREEKRREEKKNTSRRFTPPTLQEISDYCKDRGNSVNPQEFKDHYDANGWYRGKTKIKDWKACVRTWEKKESKEQGVRYI